jgi:hypothetical protein
MSLYIVSRSPCNPSDHSTTAVPRFAPVAVDALIIPTHVESRQHSPPGSQRPITDMICDGLFWRHSGPWRTDTVNKELTRM